MTFFARGVVVLAAVLVACAGAGERRATPESDTTSAAPAPALPPEAAASSTAPHGTSDSLRGVTHSLRGVADSLRGFPDSLRGVVERIGNEPGARLIVRGAAGETCAFDDGAPPALDGLEVTLWGARTRAVNPAIPGVACALRVQRYAVRAVDGVPAMDGILVESESSYALALASGARPLLRNVPAVLRAHVGARIYWAGPLDRAPAAYGVLTPAR
jgi:hypothetical protein